MPAHIQLEHVTKRFGKTTAVNDVSVAIQKGEFFSFLGPSGCGKTTILRMISGFSAPTSGTIRIAGADMNLIDPNHRPTALIFQNLALFPLMKVWENVAFGLEVRGMGRSARRLKASELLSLVELNGVEDMDPSQLSGGQRQRVAIARALAVEPEVLLLDEPLSALDLKLRQYMRAELRKIQRRTGVTFIYITHDQGEALAMSDRVAVMSEGRIEQIASPIELYQSPATAFAASFVGENNYFRGTILSETGPMAQIYTAIGQFHGRNAHRLKVGDEGYIFVRPESITNGDASGTKKNQFEARYSHVDFEGNIVIAHFATNDGLPVVIQVGREFLSHPWKPGDLQILKFSTLDANILPRGEIARELLDHGVRSQGHV